MRASKAFLFAGLGLSLAACHTNGAYLTGNGFKPKGPGVVDCGWYHRDDEGNTYVAHYCPPSRAAEIAYLAKQRFLATGQIETKWEGIPDFCGDCDSTAPVYVAGQQSTRVVLSPGVRTAIVQRQAAAPPPAPPQPLVRGYVQPAPPPPPAPPAGPPPRASRTARDEEEWEGPLPPPKPGAPLPGRSSSR
jgi:hypothetical protein